MNSHWDFIDGGERDGAYNMRFDEHLAQRLLAGRGRSTLRLYRWKPWAISLGHHQDVSEVDSVRCAHDGIDIVRRPTGGRAILHADELTYCVVFPANGSGIQESYRHVSRALARGLNLFGIEATLQRSQPDFPRSYREGLAVACFISSARYEIQWGNRKLVGSAQRRYKGANGEVVLQHGSILCGPGHQALYRYVRIDDGERRRLEDQLRMKTVDLNELAGSSAGIAHLAECIKSGFEEEWRIGFDSAEPDFATTIEATYA